MYINKAKILNNPDRVIVKVTTVPIQKPWNAGEHMINTLRNVSQVCNGAYLCTSRGDRWYVFPSAYDALRFKVVVDTLYPNFNVALENPD